MQRRTLLMGGLTATFGGSTVLGACTPARVSPPGPAPSSGSAALPAYVPFTRVAPDGPATESGAAPFYRAYPADPPKFAAEVPLSGGRVEVLTIMNTTPSAVAGNRWWQAVNKAVGGEITMVGAPVADYVSKFQAMVSGGQLPDLSVITPGSIPQLGPLLEAKFHDLTDLLAGDAVKQFPSLANIPTVAWRGCSFNGRIRAVPIHRFSLRRQYLLRTDLAERYGVTTTPKSGEELLALLRGVASPDQGRFATAHAGATLDWINEMHGTPNGWQVNADGTWTKDYETETFVESLSIVRDLWSQRVIHPNAFQPNINPQGFFDSAVIACFPITSSWATNAASALKADPRARVIAVDVMKWDGSGPAARWLNNGAPYLTGLRAASPDRAGELMRLINWLASPWGTQENLLARYGVEGHNYARTADGGLQSLDATKGESLSPMQYAGSAAMVHYNGVYPDLAKAEYDSEVSAMRAVAPLPTVGLESETDQTKGAVLERDMQALVADVIQGRQSVGDWAAGVKRWRDKGGDQVRDEYQKAHAAA